MKVRVINRQQTIAQTRKENDLQLLYYNYNIIYIIILFYIITRNYL